jgi:hypothetical protein
MPIRTTNESILIEVALWPADIPALVQRHLSTVSATRELEQGAQDLLAQGFPPHALQAFIRHVCKWGGYAGVAGRILKHNALVQIRTSFQNALACLELPTPDVEKALTQINTIHGLGKPSFASKHLRFLCPALCPVLDSLLSRKLAYRYDARGYGRFAGDCLSIAKTLQECEADNPVARANGRWYAADVEMALFALLR